MPEVVQSVEEEDEENDGDADVDNFQDEEC